MQLACGEKPLDVAELVVKVNNLQRAGSPEFVKGLFKN